MGRNNSIEQEQKENKQKNSATKAGQGNPKLDRPDRPAT